MTRLLVSLLLMLSLSSCANVGVEHYADQQPQLDLERFFSKPVKAWLAEHKEQIEVFYLPSYSPDLNPDERLNADLKQAMGKKVPVRTKAKLREAANEHMLMIEQSPERVKSFFGDPKVKYAAG